MRSQHCQKIVFWVGDYTFFFNFDQWGASIFVWFSSKGPPFGLCFWVIIWLCFIDFLRFRRPVFRRAPPLLNFNLKMAVHFCDLLLPLCSLKWRPWGDTSGNWWAAQSAHQWQLDRLNHLNSKGEAGGGGVLWLYVVATRETWPGHLTQEKWDVRGLSWWANVVATRETWPGRLTREKWNVRGLSRWANVVATREPVTRHLTQQKSDPRGIEEEANIVATRNS